MPNGLKPILTTQELPNVTGLSASFFEKGRVNGYGPTFMKLGGRVFYRRADVEAWMEARRRDPEERSDV